MRAFRILIVLSVISVAGIAYGMNVKTDYDRSFDFGKLKTFAFRDQQRPDGNLLARNSIVDNRIREALRRDLEARGFRYQPDGQADFVIAYYARERQQAEVGPIGYGMPFRWRWGWGPGVWTNYYTQGSIVVDLIEPASNQLIWRGRATDTVNGLDQSEKQINKGVKKLVKDFAKDSEKKR